jgi:alpha-L-arabinofuranosidase
MVRKHVLLTAAAALLLGVASFAQTHRMDIDLKKVGAPIQPTMYGIFFEDINFAADGGLYAELVKNRSFEFPQDPLQGWKAFGKVEVREDGPFERCPHYVRLVDPGHPHKWTGLDNEGFFGIGVKGGEQYRFTVWARVPDGGSSDLRLELVNTASMGENQFFCQEPLRISGSDWKQYEVLMTPPQTLEKAVLRIFLVGPRTTVDLEHVSLFPVDTWMGHRNGMRKDLAQALADLKPGIFRFPGGCIVEGADLPTRYNWKNTVGPVENRPINENRWEYTFPHRFFPDYFQSYGLGFFEFFQLSEEIGSEPLPILSCGLACQFQNDDPAAHCPVDELQPFIQDALDLIEFANGPVTSTWGKVRAEMGHPAPFNLKFIGIGNEQWDSIYPEHLEPFVKAIRAAYPDIKIVGTSGPDSEGKQFDYLWPEMKRLGADLVDEHFYRPYDWFLAQGARYDNYDRKGPKVFAGEYACHAKGRKYNHFKASLLEAAFMTTIERNADIVHMATYAPLFAHIEGWQWRPDLIWYDNLRSMRTASWHVQQLYGQYKGQNALTLKMNGVNVTGAAGQDGLFASAVKDGDKVYVKVINTSEEPQEVEFAFGGLKKKETVKAVECVKLHSDLLYEDNTLDVPDRITPMKAAFTGEGKTISATVDPLTFAIFVLEK